jgi:hypothetical protein
LSESNLTAVVTFNRSVDELVGQLDLTYFSKAKAPHFPGIDPLMAAPDPLAEDVRVHPDFQMMLRRALTRPGNEAPIGPAKTFLDHYLKRVSLPSITPLQKELHGKVFGAEGIFESTAHVLMSGPTSSGKTTAANLFLLRAVFVNGGVNARALFLSPTKALAHEKYESLKTSFDGYKFQDDVEAVVISTGDESDADPLIAAGNFRIACTVYEKANILFSRNPAILQQLGVVVIDELHMFMDLERGPMLELIAAKLQSSRSALEFLTTPGESGTLRPRILGISTDENLVKAFRLPLAIERFNQEALPPIEIHDPTRPTNMRHKLVMPVGVDGEVEELLIGSTQETGFPALTGERRRSLVDHAIECFGRYRAAEVQARKTKSRIASKEERIREFLLLLDQANPFGERILCFVPSRSMAEGLANELANKRPEISPSPKKASIMQAGLSHIEDPTVRGNFETYYNHGIFVHHSDLPSMTLRTVEELCGDPLQSGERSEVVVSTQTLSYGVNLAVSSVCICGQTFFTGFRDGETGHAPLSNCEYHNMMGRCGRFGKTTRDMTEAYILFDVFRNANENSVDDFVKAYYAVAPTFDSVVFTAEDERAEKQINKRLSFRVGHGGDKLEAATQTELVEGVKKFSLPFIRATLDALRHLNYEAGGPHYSNAEATYVSANDIADIFEKTPFGKKFLGTDASKRRMADIFHFIFKALKQREYKLIKDDSYSNFIITERGDAILNTGQEIGCIQQYQQYIYLCDDIYLHFDVESSIKAVVAPYIYLVMVLAQADVLRLGAQYTSEFVITNPPDDVVRSWREQVVGDFKERLVALVGMAIVEKLPHGLLECVFDALAGLEIEKLGKWAEEWSGTRFFGGLDKISDRRLLTSAIFRLTNFTLSWIMGENARDMERSLRQKDANVRRPKRFMGKPRFFESVSYGVAFYSALVRTGNDKLEIESEQLSYRLRLLAEQIKVGLRTEYLPFASLQGRHVTRQNVVAMCKSGLDVSCTLTGSIEQKLSGVTEEQVRTAVTGYFATRFKGLSKVWAEKGRASENRLLSNMAGMWECLDENYGKLLGLSANRVQRGKVVTDALEALFREFDKKIDMDVFGLGPGNVAAATCLTWVESFDLVINYSPDEDEPKLRRDIWIRFVECEVDKFVDFQEKKISSTDLTSLRSNDYWLVNVSSKQVPKKQLVEAMAGKMRLKHDQTLALIELDAFFVLVSALLRGFYVSINDFLELFRDNHSRHITMLDVVSGLNPRETVPQILKANVEYTSIWSFDPS